MFALKRKDDGDGRKAAGEMSKTELSDTEAAKEYANEMIEKEFRYEDGSIVRSKGPRLFYHDVEGAFLAGIAHERAKSKMVLEKIRAIAPIDCPNCQLYDIGLALALAAYKEPGT